MEPSLPSNIRCDDNSDTIEQVALFMGQCLDGLDRLDMLHLKDIDNTDLLITMVLAMDFVRNTATSAGDITIKQFWTAFSAASMTNRTSSHPLIASMKDNRGFSSRIDQLSWAHLSVYLVQAIVVTYDLAGSMNRHMMELGPWRRSCAERLLTMLDDDFIDKLDAAASSSSPATTSIQQPTSREPLRTDENAPPKTSRRIVPMCSLASLSTPLAVVGVAAPQGRTEGKRCISSGADSDGVNNLTAKKPPSLAKKMRTMSHSSERILADVSEFLDGMDAHTATDNKEKTSRVDDESKPLSRADSSSGAFYFSSAEGHKRYERNGVAAAEEGAEPGAERRLYRRKFSSTTHF